MGNTLLKYMNQRLETADDKKTSQKPQLQLAPIITISREAGCSANVIADLLYKKINTYISSSHLDANKWFCINKEIIFESAQKLGLPERKIKYVFNSEKRTALDDVVEALSSRYYKSDTVIRNTIIKLMHSYINKGKTIIVGRAGLAFCKDNTNVIHVKLVAPTDWRIDQIKQKHNISDIDAHKYISNMDAKRKSLINEYYGKDPDASFFDIVLNCKSISQYEIVEIIFKMMLAKGMLS